MADIAAAERRLRNAPAAISNLSSLADARDSAAASARGLSLNLHDAKAEIQQAHNALQNAEVRRGDKAAENTAKARQHLAYTQREVERLSALREVAERKASALTNLVDKVVRWVINELSDAARVADHTPVGRRGAKPADIRGAVDGLRSQITEFRAEIQRVERAPLPSAELKARAGELIADMIERGRPDITGLMGEEVGPLKWPTIAHMPLSAGIHRIPAFDVPAMLAWLAGPKTLQARLDAEIEALADDAAAVPAAERPAMLADLRARLLDAERREVALIDTAAEGGHVIEHRADVDPRAVLAIDIVDSAASQDAA